MLGAVSFAFACRPVNFSEAVGIEYISFPEISTHFPMAARAIIPCIQDASHQEGRRFYLASEQFDSKEP